MLPIASSRAAVLPLLQPKPWQFPEVSRYWDARQGVTSSAERASNWLDMKLGTDLAQASGAAQPILLPYAGVNYCWNDGVASNTITCPTASMTGNLTFSLDHAEDDYTPGSDITLASKLSGNDGFALLLLTTGVLRLRIGDGVSVTNVDSSEAVGTTDFTRNTFGIVWTDGVGASFTKNGAALGTAVAAVKTLTNAAVSLTIGPWNGKHYGLTITNGVSTTYYNSTTAAATEGAATYSSNGQTYTVNTSGAKPAQIVGSQQLLGDGAAHYMESTGLVSGNNPFNIWAVAKKNSGSSLNVIVSTGLDSDSPTGYYAFYNPGAANPEVVRTAFATGNGQLDSAGNYAETSWHVYGMSYAGVGAAHKLYVDGVLATNAYASGNITQGVFRIFRSIGGSYYANQLKALAFGTTAMSDARMHQLGRAMAAQHGVSL